VNVDLRRLDGYRGRLDLDVDHGWRQRLGGIDAGGEPAEQFQEPREPARGGLVVVWWTVNNSDAPQTVDDGCDVRGDGESGASNRPLTDETAVLEVTVARIDGNHGRQWPRAATAYESGQVE
jgi:hypothetical protein